MKNIALSILLCLPFWSSAQYSLIWADEFNGTSLDNNNWTTEIGTGVNGWGNWEEQYYTANPSNIRLDSGFLHITAIKENYNGSAYTSARIKTKDKFQFRYGKIEARMKLPQGQGFWPAFWLLGANIDTVSWPQCGEIDIMEHVNSSAFVNAAIHYDNNGHLSSGNQTLCDVSEFQDYSIEWTENRIRWYLNDVLYHEENITGGFASKEEFHKPFFILLNLAVGGTWPGAPDVTTAFPSDMIVDYVRVFQKTPLPNTPNDITFNALNPWQGYMNVFELPSNGGGYIFGSPWNLNDLQTNIDCSGNTMTLQPNFNTYNAADPFWVNQTTFEGNKDMEASTFVEPGASFNGTDLTFSGEVLSNTLDAGYTANFFIKALDPNNGYADALGGLKTFPIPASGSFSVSATGAELAPGLIVQYGFSIRGANANPANEAALGAILIGSLLPAPDSFEPNNALAQAASYPTNDVISGNAFICEDGDEDWFSYNIGSYSSLKVQLLCLPKDYQLEVYNASLNLLGSSYNPANQAEKIILNGLAPGGDYYIRVFGLPGEFSTAIGYCLKVNTGNYTMFANEEDEEQLNSTTITPITLSPNPFSDKILISGLKEDSEIWVTDITGRQVYHTFSNQPDLSFLKPGVYWLKVSSQNEQSTFKIVKI